MDAFRERKRNDKFALANVAEKIISNALGKYIASSTPFINLKEIFIDPQKAYKILDIGERGELLFVEVAANSAFIIPEIILYDDKGQPSTTINDKTFQELLSLGRGMTPGRVQPSATGQTQDEVSDFMPNVFHLGRYKDDKLTDWVDTSTENPNPDRYIVGRIVCTTPFPYSAISIYIKNTTTDSIKRIYSVTVGRTVYESAASPPNAAINPEELAGVEIPGDEVDVENEVPTPEDEEQLLLSTNYNVGPS